MGCGCSSSIVRKVADLSTENDFQEKRARARAKSVASTLSSTMGIDKAKIVMPLTDREKLVLMRSWERMHRDIVEHGMVMFVRLFESNPQVKDVFEKFSGVDSVADLWQLEVLKIHGMSVMSAIDDIIANIDDKDVVLELIIEQGQSHAHFGFPENMAAEIFWAIEQPFLLAVKEALRDKFDDRIGKIYEKTIKFILASFVQSFKVGKTQKLIQDTSMDEKRLSVATTNRSILSRSASIARSVSDL